MFESENGMLKQLVKSGYGTNTGEIFKRKFCLESYFLFKNIAQFRILIF